MKQPRGYILHETDQLAVIATVNSANAKTGDMIQVWILNRREYPAAAITHRTDDVVCLDCPLRGNGHASRACYVEMKGPTAVYGAYARGSYPYLDPSDYSEVFADRAVRFGAYGEPVLIPLEIVWLIVATCKKHTGYTHQWRKSEYAGYRAFLMASCDTWTDYRDAKRAGWRTFRVSVNVDPSPVSEISCPASEESGHRVQCADCELCSGSVGDGDARKDITIRVHGIRQRYFQPVPSAQMKLGLQAVQLVQIGA